jgi:hypothetical protein
MGQGEAEVGLSRSRTLFLIGLAVLIALSLSPSERVEVVVDRVLGPLRHVGDLARPFTWFSRAGVLAAEQDAERALDEERAESRAILRAAESAAMPAQESLRRGHTLVAAYVILHAEKRADEILVRFPPDAEVTAGLPVVCGEAYVGRVTALDPDHPGVGLVMLVTDKVFRVGAVVGPDDTGVRLVVGGLIAKALRAKGAPLELAAQFPDRSEPPNGLVRVLEGTSGDPAPADGFLLGTLLVRRLRGFRVLAVRPVLDFEHGLDHLAIVCPLRTASAPLALDPFDDASWIDVRCLLAGNASPLRRTRTITAGTRERLRPGAALAIGARFIGRIERASPLVADAALIGDPGMAFSALAKVEGRAQPLVLGRLVSLGLDRESGEALLRWEAVVPLPSELGHAAGAELYTAAGESDVPPGLKVGRTTLPAGTGPFVLRVILAQDARALVRLRAWRTSGSTRTGSGS